MNFYNRITSRTIWHLYSCNLAYFALLFWPLVWCLSGSLVFKNQFQGLKWYKWSLNLIEWSWSRFFFFSENWENLQENMYVSLFVKILSFWSYLSFKIVKKAKNARSGHIHDTTAVLAVIKNSKKIQEYLWDPHEDI